MSTEELFEQLDHLLDRVSAIDFASAEETGALGQIVRQRPEALGLLQEGDDLLREVEERFEGEEADRSSSDAAPSDSLLDIGHMISTEMAAQGLADLAFIARGDLRACIQDLRGADTQDPWKLAALMARSVRRLRRGLISVESAIFEFEGQEAPIRVWGDLDTSLEVRKLYGEIRRQVRALDDASEAEVSQRIEEVAGRFSELASHRIYPLLRIEDRQEIRQIHRRMRQWLRDRDEEAGERLWEDIVGFVALLGAVNQREELRQHDRRVVNRAHKRLFGSRGVAYLSESLLKELRSLEGLDEELDQLLLDPDNYPLATWQEPLGRLRTNLRGLQGAVTTPFG